MRCGLFGLPLCSAPKRDKVARADVYSSKAAFASNSVPFLVCQGQRFDTVNALRLRPDMRQGRQSAAYAMASI